MQENLEHDPLKNYSFNMKKKSKFSKTESSKEGKYTQNELDVMKILEKQKDDRKARSLEYNVNVLRYQQKIGA